LAEFHVRLAYDRGKLEMVGPSAELCPGSFLGTLVWTLTAELGLPIHAGGSTTLRRRDRRRGIDPNQCFWIANAHRMAGRRRLDLRSDQPPDLAIEIDVIRSSLNRTGIYAALGVPEVWRLRGDKLTFFVLEAEGTYGTAPSSRSFPLVTPADLLGFVQQARQGGDENVVVREVRAWIRQRQRGSATPPPTP
jgi:Uma2 family endonuclease